MGKMSPRWVTITLPIDTNPHHNPNIKCLTTPQSLVYLSETVWITEERVIREFTFVLVLNLGSLNSPAGGLMTRSTNFFLFSTGSRKQMISGWETRCDEFPHKIWLA